MTSAPDPVASVVIPARDAAHTVGATLDGLALASVPLQVIVVDDGSRDATADVAAAKGAEVVRGAGEGPARARNLGCARAKADVLVFTDADCRPTAGFVEALLAPLADPGVAGTKGAYLSEQRALTARFVQQEYEERYRRMARRSSIDFVDTYACAYRKPVFDAVGGFDERYRLPSTEDQELSFRVAETGARLMFVPEARVLHLHVDWLGGYARKKAKIGRFKVATLRRHPGKAVSDAHTPQTLKLQLLLAPLALGAPWVAPLLLAAEAPAWSAVLCLLPALAFLLSTLPLALHALRADPLVGVLTPGFCLVRALALGAGLLGGLWAELRGGVLPEETRA
ncbi:MAG: glycosyltransferase [Planctomycetota bacterium]